MIAPMPNDCASVFTLDEDCGFDAQLAFFVYSQWAGLWVWFALAAARAVVAASAVDFVSAWCLLMSGKDVI